MNKLLIAVTAISLFFILLGASIFLNIKLLLENNWKDDSVKAIEIVVKQPVLFKIPPDYQKEIEYLYSIYKTINKENYSKFSEFGSTIFEIKNACITRALNLIGNSITKDFRGYKLYNIGGDTHGFLTYAIGMEKYTTDEVNLYINNMDKIIAAIPKNIPSKDSLIKTPINSITYYADYAKIIYNADLKIEQIEANNQRFIGKKYVDKF